MLSFRPKHCLGAAALVFLSLQAPLALAQQAQELPDMAAIEQAWLRGDFTSVRVGVEQDYVRAHAWPNIAAASGQSRAARQNDPAHLQDQGRQNGTQ
jgi:hypothetical protein